MKNWYIRYFDDYHEILDYEGSYKAEELGCWEPKDNQGYRQYFGLFYKGRRPSFTDIFKSIKSKVLIGSSKHIYTGAEIGISIKELEEELKDALK